MKAFYFANQERKLRYGDNRPIVVGETHTVDVEPVPCEQGLHASKKLLDALRYAPGSILYLVELGGQIVETDDKVCASRRTYLAEFDATQLLVKFDCQCALEVVEQIRPYTKDYYSIVAFLRRPTADAVPHAAYAAANAANAAYAAYDSAYAAAQAAAHAADAARAADAAYHADYTDVHDAHVAYAAIHAAYHAAYAADNTDDSTRAKQNDLLTAMVKKATGWDI